MSQIKGAWKEKNFDATSWKAPVHQTTEVPDVPGRRGERIAIAVWIAACIFFALLLATQMVWGGEVGYTKPDLWCQYFHKEVVPESFPWALDEIQVQALYETEVWYMYLWAENMLCGKGLYGLYLRGRLGRA